MGRALLTRWLACLSLPVVLLLGAPVQAAKDEEGPPRYKGPVHKDGKEEEQKFDLSKQEDVDKLVPLLKEGKIEHLEKDKKISVLDFPERWDLAIWTLVVFLALLFILKKFAWKPMLEGLQKREENIHSAIEEARKTREDARRIQGELQQQLDKAAETVREILDEARRDAQYTKDQMVAAARAEIQTERDRLHRELETARDQALKMLWDQTAQLATLVSAKAIQRHITQEDHRRLVDEALAELGRVGAARQRQVAGVS